MTPQETPQDRQRVDQVGSRNSAGDSAASSDSRFVPSEAHRRDDELRDMLHSVPVPAERMERLRQTWPVSLRGSIGQGSPVESARQYRSKAEWWMTAIALSVMAASLMVAAWMIWPTGWRGVDRSELANLATSSWEDSAANERWRPFQHQAAGRKFHRASKYLRRSPKQWRRFETALDSEAVVFDLSLRGQSGQLFVLRSGKRLEWLPERPPEQPQESSGGGNIAAWQEGDLVYVLSVDGPDYAYWNAIKSKRTSFARFGD